MKRLKGFTLVELVIVIAIVIILSMVSVPIYKGYTKNAKMSEGYALFGVILSAQKTYFSQYGNFLDDYEASFKGGNFSCNEEVLGIDARGNKYFSYFYFDTAKENSNFTKMFNAYLVKPEELITDKNKPCIKLIYYITKGSSFIDNVEHPYNQA